MVEISRNAISQPPLGRFSKTGYQFDRLVTPDSNAVLLFFWGSFLSPYELMSCSKVRRHKDAIVSLTPDQQGDTSLYNRLFYVISYKMPTYPIQFIRFRITFFVPVLFFQ